ncbi:MAG: alpha/beta hydrolase-fold protein [Firmicutes bacterium]|nr:alpha/beta hydrolase-fold protein [Bacillota bacterium]
MIYYTNVSIVYGPEIEEKVTCLLQPPFRVVKYIPGIGVLSAFEEEALPALRALIAALDWECVYYWDKKGRSHKLTATEITPARKVGPGRNRRIMRGMERWVKWDASDKRLCEGVSERVVIPDGRVPFFWRYKRFALVRPGDTHPFRYSLRMAKGKGEYPLVVYLHSAGGWGINGVGALREAAPLPQILLRKCHVLAPQFSLSSPYAAQAGEDLGEVIASVPHVDRARVYLMGTSMGGCGAVIECRRHPGRYAACVTSVAWLQNLENPGKDADENEGPLDEKAFDALARTPLWLGYGRDEKSVNEALYEALKERGADVRRTHYKRFGHILAGPVFLLKPRWAHWLFQHKTGEGA